MASASPDSGCFLSGQCSGSARWVTTVTASPAGRI